MVTPWGFEIYHLDGSMVLVIGGQGGINNRETREGRAGEECVVMANVYTKRMEAW